MEINQMKYFREIVRQGSFSAASEVLHISQPALSKSIAKMEAELGAPLLERHGTRVTLTSAGEVLLPYCADVLSDLENAITAFQESIGQKTGRVTIAVSTEIFIKHLIHDFLNENPEVSLTCYLMSPDEMIRALDEGTVDFVLSETPIHGEHIKWKLLYSGYLTAVVNREDPLLNKKILQMQDLKDHMFCMGHIRSSLYNSIHALCADAGFTPRIRYRGYDPDMAGMLLELPGSVLISSDIINYSLRSADLNVEEFPARRIAGTEGKALIGTAFHEGHYRTEAADAFFNKVVDFYRSVAGNVPY